MSRPSSDRNPRSPGVRVALQVAVAYALLGAGWILISDRVLQALTRTPEAFARWQSIKGWAYVGATALLLYAVLRVYVGSRERAEEALRDSEERYRDFFETSRDAVFITSLDGRWIDMNRAAVELFGYESEAELWAVPIESLYADPADREAHLDVIIEQGSTKDYPVDLRRKDGSIIHTLISTVTRTDDSGWVAGFQGTIRDVTERRQAQERIEHLNAVLRAIREVNQLLVREKDRDRLVQGACDLLIDTRGYDSAWVALLDEAGRVQTAATAGQGEHLAWILEELRGGRRPSCVERALPGGRVVVVGDPDVDCAGCGLAEDHRKRSAMTVRLHHQGRTHGLLSVCLPRHFSQVEEEQTLFREVADDIAFGLSNLELENELRRSEARYRTLFNSASDAILIHDLEGRFLEVNGVACERLGYTRDELLQMGPSDIDAPEYADLVPDRVARLRAEGQLYFETAHVRRDGTRIPSELSSRIIDYEGKPAVLTIARDISQRKGLERQLRQQERLAAMGRLAGGVAHDFNNLLAAIILNAQFALRADDLPPRAVDALQSILQESEHAADLVDQILDFTRRGMVESELIDLVELVERTAALLRRTLPENVRVVVDPAPQACVVEADRTRIHQALLNLAGNARDAMPDGGELRIRVGCVEVATGELPPVAGMAPGDYACLSVADTGVGMDEEVLENLFEPFFTTKEAGQGTGLGLAQVYGIVKQHHGLIDVDTAVGEGTTFSIYLPLAPAAPTEDEGVAAGHAPAGRGETILLVEDAARLRQAVQAGLESLGYRVLAAANAPEAVELQREQSVDLVITDIVMPGGSGIDLLKHLRAEAPELRVVAMTGHVFDTEAPLSELEAFHGLIRKPFSIEELAEAIRDALDTS